ncbi:MAG: trypsin-like peptidase domain-containing protein [Candidatus Poribacteria bacterium]|nr:trypsin-like peptidase domain-containing protein [Candidatus Poribacteria bacterium]
MKQTYFPILTLLLTLTFFTSNVFAQDYVHYKTLTGHTFSVKSIGFSSDGRMLASGDSGGIIRLWNASAGTHRRILIGDLNWVSSVAFSPDGQTLASGSLDHTIRLWDVVIGQHKKTLTGHKDMGWNVLSFNPDGQILASGSLDRTIRLWDVLTGTNKRTLTGHTGSVSSVAFSPDGQILASGSYDNTIRLWDMSTGTNKRTLTGHTDGVSSVAFSPDGQILASGSLDRTIRLWDVVTGQHKKTLIGPNLIWSISFSFDGQILASGSLDHTIRLWDVNTGQHKKTLIGHTGGVSSVAFSSDGQMLASGSLDKTIRLWKLTSPTPPKPTANQVYTNAIRAVMWIVNPEIGEGSGVLLDKKHKLAVTNAHVTGPQNTIDVYFPAPDEKGELIKDRNFYLTSGNVLKRLGYYTKGHVVAKNEKTDLAIIRLDGLPETAREIDWKLTSPITKAGELVYILGNPAKQELWRWTLGEFLNDHGDFLHIQSDVFGGNSGGPVLNKQGILLGIVARSDQLMNAAAIPIRHINRLLSESKVKHSRIRR